MLSIACDVSVLKQSVVWRVSVPWTQDSISEIPRQGFMGRLGQFEFSAETLRLATKPRIFGSRSD